MPLPALSEIMPNLNVGRTDFKFIAYSNASITVDILNMKGLYCIEPYKFIEDASNFKITERSYRYIYYNSRFDNRQYYIDDDVARIAGFNERATDLPYHITTIIKTQTDKLNAISQSDKIVMTDDAIKRHKTRLTMLDIINYCEQNKIKLQ